MLKFFLDTTKKINSTRYLELKTGHSRRHCYPFTRVYYIYVSIWKAIMTWNGHRFDDYWSKEKRFRRAPWLRRYFQTIWIGLNHLSNYGTYSNNLRANNLGNNWILDFVISLKTNLTFYWSFIRTSILAVFPNTATCLGGNKLLWKTRL